MKFYSLWHFLVLIVADMKCSCLCVLLVYAALRTRNCVSLVILIGTVRTIWLMIHVHAKVNACIRICMLQDRAVLQTECHTMKF